MYSLSFNPFLLYSSPFNAVVTIINYLDDYEDKGHGNNNYISVEKVVVEYKRLITNGVLSQYHSAFIS